MKPQGHGCLIYKKKRKVPVYLLVLIIAVLALAAVICLKEFQSSDSTDNKSKNQFLGEAKVEGSIKSRIGKNTDKSPLPVQNNKLSSEKIKKSSPPVEKKSMKGSILDHRASDLKKRRLIFKGMNYFNIQQYREAIPVFKKIVQTSKAYFVYLGISYFKIEDYKNAFSALQKALYFDDKSFITLKYMALTSYKIGKLESSGKYGRKALKIMDDKQLKSLLDRISREAKVMKYYGQKSREHFEIRFSRYDHNTTGSLVLEVLEEAYREIGKKMNYFLKDKTRVILYNEKTFFDVTRAPGWAGGLYDGIIRLPVQGISRISKDLKRIIFHEFTHAYVHEITRSCPLWLNEGLAEYCSIGENAGTIGQIIPLNQLERSFPAGNIKTVAIAYRESYSAVKYLIDKYRMYKILELLQVLSEERNIKRAFRKVFLISYTQFLNTWGVKR